MQEAQTTTFAHTGTSFHEYEVKVTQGDLDRAALRGGAGVENMNSLRSIHVKLSEEQSEVDAPV